MGIANRHSGAPFIDGESLSATDLELDVSAIYEAFGGQVEDVNIVTDAQIVGSKLLAESVSGTRVMSLALVATHLAADSVTEDKLENEAVGTPHLSQLGADAITHADQDVNTVLLAQSGAIVTETVHNSLVFTAPTESHAVLLFGSAMYDSVQIQVHSTTTWRINRDGNEIVRKQQRLMDSVRSQNSFGGSDWKDWVSLIGVDAHPVAGAPVTYTFTSQRPFANATYNYRESILVAVALRR